MYYGCKPSKLDGTEIIVDDILNFDFEILNSEDFIYFDPPYDSDTSTFNSYTEDGFSKEEQIRLAKVYKELADKNTNVIFCAIQIPP